MKRKIGLMVGFAMIVALGLATVSHAQQAIDMKDLKALCEEGYANASQTRDIVANGIKAVGAEITNESSELKKGELEDGKFWYEKANKLLDSSRARMDKGEYTKDLNIDLNQAWQWYIKAGAAVTRAGMQE
ncbi:MAG: hypothetical protein WDA72_01925 [Desulfomonilia bacterium]|nr:hypothetical protein [Deltaproteobacteria bacterium]MDX9761272.1 hypothetical protein [Desulfomonilia bacterium]